MTSTPTTQRRTEVIQAAVWQAIGQIDLVQIEPAPLGSTDVEVEVASCGICGSDVHRFLEGQWSTPGQRLGHEFAGTVSALGADVVGLQVGDRVAVNPAVPCGDCERCAQGRTNLCSALRGAEGGLAHRVRIPNARVGRQVFVMPDSMTMDEGALLEPLSVAVRGVRREELDPQAPVLVAGLGSIGQCAVRVLLDYGIQNVIGVDSSPLRREAAGSVGAQVLAPAEVREYVLERWGEAISPYQRSGQLQGVFECSGASQALTQATELVRPGGFISLLGLYAEPPAVDINAAVQKELLLRGAFAYTPEDVQEAFRLASSGRLDLGALISDHFALSNVQQAFERQAATGESIKVMVHPEPQGSSPSRQ